MRAADAAAPFQNSSFRTPRFHAQTARTYCDEGKIRWRVEHSGRQAGSVSVYWRAHLVAVQFPALLRWYNKVDRQFYCL